MIAACSSRFLPRNTSSHHILHHPAQLKQNTLANIFLPNLVSCVLEFGKLYAVTIIPPTRIWVFNRALWVRLQWIDCEFLFGAMLRPKKSVFPENPRNLFSETLWKIDAENPWNLFCENPLVCAILSIRVPNFRIRELCRGEAFTHFVKLQLL